MSAPDPVRCAIYTRKSHEAGLQLAYNSLHAQHDACEAYIRSQESEGWEALPPTYSDGGFSGGRMDRPALQRLLADIEAGAVDVVVVHKIDRLTRSLADFARLIEVFERRGVTFVSVTQQFSTTTSMGRLTLNVLLSFAQFEREITSERIRDKKAAARAKGLWSSARPYGYTVTDGRLEPHAQEAPVIRRIFRRYATLGSSRLLVLELACDGIVNRQGRQLTQTWIVTKLHNRLYRGELVHYGRAVPGSHPALITEREWRAAHAVIADSARRRAARMRPPTPCLLRGLLYTPDDHAMVHTCVTSRGRLYRYYVSGRERYGPGSDPAGRFRAPDLETAVGAQIERLTGSPMPERHADACLRVRRVVERVQVRPDGMTLILRTGAVIEAPHAGRIGSKETPQSGLAPAEPWR